MFHRSTVTSQQGHSSAVNEFQPIAFLLTGGQQFCISAPRVNKAQRCQRYNPHSEKRTAEDRQRRGGVSRASIHTGKPHRQRLQRPRRPGLQTDATERVNPFRSTPPSLGYQFVTTYPQTKRRSTID